MREEPEVREPTVTYTRLSAAPPAPAPASDATSLGTWLIQAEIGQDLTLAPGQTYFGGRAATVRTLVGTCVAISLWHPQRRLGGICHFQLPGRTRTAAQRPDGRYGDEAVTAMMKALQLTDTDPRDYQAHLYGGADSAHGSASHGHDPGPRNVAQAWRLIDRYGFQLQSVDVGEPISRTVVLTLASGAVDMCRISRQTAAATSL